MSGSPQLGHLSPELLGKIFGYTTVPDILGLKSVGPVTSFCEYAD